MIVDKKQNTAGVIDAAIPDDRNIRKKEKNKSVPEAEETTKVHGTTLVTSKMVPVVTGGLAAGKVAATDSRHTKRT